METIINALRQVLGVPDFYVRLGPNSNYSWDYGAMIEYFVGALLLCIVVSSIFRIVAGFFKRS